MQETPLADSMTQLRFLHLCLHGDIKEISDLLGSGAVDMNYMHPYQGWSALHFAALGGNREVIRILLAAGYRREAEGFGGDSPVHIVPYSQSTDKELLLADLSFEGQFMPSLECSVDSNGCLLPGPSLNGTMTSAGFYPAFTPPPAFRSTRSLSLDSTSSSPPSSSSFSYGRRDSLNRTRFLLIRTSHDKGKETFTRVTLPGGSGYLQLKKSIEKAMRQRVVAVYLLPDRVLLEKDSQIAAFAGCQKVDVIFDDGEFTPEPAGDVPSSPKFSVDSSLTDSSPSLPCTSKHPALSQHTSMDIPATIQEAPSPIPNGDEVIVVPVEDDTEEKRNEERVEEEVKEIEVPKEEKDEEDMPKDCAPLTEFATSERESENNFEEVFAEDVVEEKEETPGEEKAKEDENEEEAQEEETLPLPPHKGDSSHSSFPQTLLSLLSRNIAILSAVTAFAAAGFYLSRRLR